MEYPLHGRREAIAIIGGGRWARVYLSVLSSIDLQYELVVASRANASRIVSAQPLGGGDIAVVETVDDLLQHYDVKAAIVVNAARLHCDAALRLVEAGASVLVEKPLALTVSDVLRLKERAAAKGVCVVPSLTFLHCSYLYRFAGMISEADAPVVRLQIEWRDPRSEIRYDEEKNYDPGVSIAHDVVPHIWAILASTLGAPKSPPNIRSCLVQRGGRVAEFEIGWMDVVCKVVLEREAGERRRFLSVELASGTTLALDFTSEPGTVTLADKTISADPDWNDVEKPVLRQLKAFLAQLSGRGSDSDFCPQVIGSVSLAEEADSFLKCCQMMWLQSEEVISSEEDIVYAVRELCCSQLYATGQIHPGDRVALNKWAVAAVKQHRMRNGGAQWGAILETLKSGASRISI